MSFKIVSSPDECGLSFTLSISVFVALLRTDAGFCSCWISHYLKENLRGS